jgi:hypothetical protein
MDIVYPLSGANPITAPLPSDPELKRFVDSLGRSLSPVDPQLPRMVINSRERFIDVLTHLMCNGSAWHEHVGSVAEYTIDPKFIGVRLLPTAEGQEPMSGVQAYTLSLSLTMLTGLKMPSIIDDWAHLFAPSHDRAASDPAYERQCALLLASYRKFRGELIHFETEVRGRNKTRLYPFRSFNPENIEVSVSL